MGGSEGNWGGGAWVLPLSVAVAAVMLSLRAGDAVVAVDCDQRFTLATSGWAALERRRGRGEAADEEAAAAAWCCCWWWWWCWAFVLVAVWGGSALLAMASPSLSEPERWTGTMVELVMEPARDWRRRCEEPGWLLGVGSAAARRGVLMLRALRLLMCLRPSRG